MLHSTSATNSTIPLDSNLARQYSEPVTGRLKKLASEAKNGEDHWRVVFHDPKDGATISCKFHIFHYVWHVFIKFIVHWFESYSEIGTYLTDNEKTFKYFNKIFGEERIHRWEKAYKRLENQPFIWKQRECEDLELTKSDLKRLLGALSCVTKEDLEEVLENIQDDTAPKTILYLNEDQTRNLVAWIKEKKQAQQGRDITLKDLTTDEVDFFYDLLKPFSFEEASLHSGEHKTTGYDRGYTMEGLLKLSGKIEEVRNLYMAPPHPNPEMICPGLERKNAKAEVTLAKKIMGYYNPDGTMIRTQEGWFHVEHKLDSAGMYMVYLSAINQQNADRLYFLHTQSLGFIPWKWQPLREILTRDSGQNGIRKADQLRRIIHKKVKDNPNYTLKVYGYSLGATGARRFLADCLARDSKDFIRELTTFSGLGIDKDTSEWIDRRLAQRNYKPLITDYRDYADRVSLAGDSVPMPDRLVYFCDESEYDSCVADPKMLLQSYSNFFGLLFDIYRSINGTHSNEVTEKTRYVCYTKEKNTKTIQELIDNSSTNYERIRQSVAKWFSTTERYTHYLDDLEEERTRSS